MVSLNLLKKLTLLCLFLVVGIGIIVNCDILLTSNTLSAQVLLPGELASFSLLPTKSATATTALKHFESHAVSSILECSPEFEEYTSESFSKDHFPQGRPNECKVKITRSRITRFLTQIHAGDGGVDLCPEVAETYERVASLAPDGTVICETGFNVGASAAIFLHGATVAGKLNTNVVSFDL